MDTQTVELLGRNRLVEQLLEAGLEVALPLRDHGIDLIAYADRCEPSFVACPIQMKAATLKSFGIDRKYEKFPNLIHAFVWGVGAVEEVETYALTHKEAVAVGHAMGYTCTASWKAGLYTTSNPSRKLVKLLQQYRMTPPRWLQLVTSLQTCGGL